MESQPQNPEFRIDPENFHPCFKADGETGIVRFKFDLILYVPVSIFSHVRIGLPGLTSTKQRIINISCSRTQRKASGVAQTNNPLISSQAYN